MARARASRRAPPGPPNTCPRPGAPWRTLPFPPILTLRPTVRALGMSGARGSTAEAEPAAATGYGFGHFARGFVDHFAFEADRATSFAFCGQAIGGQDAFRTGVARRVG